MRTMRPYSRMTMVCKPIQRIEAMEALAGALAGTALLSSMGPPVLHQPHEDLLESIHLVAHAQHLDAAQRELRKQLIEILLLRDVGLERVVVDSPQDETGHARRREQRIAGIEHEALGVQRQQQVGHAG